MQTIRITSRQNPLIKMWSELKKDRFNETFLVEGTHLVEMAALSKSLIAYISVDDFNPYEVDHYVIHPSIVDKLSSFKNSPGIFGLCQKSRSSKIEMGNILYLDNLRDPGNLGTILRSALAFNFKTIIASPNSVDFYNDKVISGAQGAHFFLDLHVEDYEGIKKLKKEGFKLVVTTLSEAEGLDKLSIKDKIILVIGNEANGVSEPLILMADQKIKITMSPQIESLNAGVAASIIMHHHFLAQK